MKLNDEELKILHKLYYDDKLSIKEIARYFKVHETTMSPYIKSLGWSRPPLGNKRFIDETGNTYGYLTVIKALDECDADHRRLFLCRCKCGREVKVPGKRLRGGHTRSCGCLQVEKARITIQKIDSEVGKDLTGQRFGKLTVIREANKLIKPNGSKRRRWLCRCDCGNEILVQHTYLTTGETKSCGCIKSGGELEIEYLLKENNINFVEQYSFPQLKNKIVLRFDFALLDEKNKLKYLIEFDGEQHYMPSNGHFSKERAEADIKKNKYCLDNNIPLLRIPYKYLGKITLNMLLLDKEESKQFLVDKEDYYGLKDKYL